MLELPRRHFLQSAVAFSAIGAVALEEACAPEPARPALLADIDHIIIMMKENRSFDHYFGTLAGVRGFSDPKAMRLPGGGSVFEQPDAASPSGVARPFRLDTTRTSAQRLAYLGHDWSVQHASFAGGRMDGWLSAHRASDDERGPLTMGYLTRADSVGGLDVVLGRWIIQFHKTRHVQPRHGRTILKERQFYYRWCFSDLQTARALSNSLADRSCEPNR